MRRLFLVGASAFCLSCTPPTKPITPSKEAPRDEAPTAYSGDLLQQEARQLYEKLASQEGANTALQKALDDYLSRPLRGITPEDASKLAQALNPKDFFPEDGLFLPTTPLLEPEKTDADHRYLAPLLEYQELLSLLSLYLELHAAEANAEPQKQTLGFEKILARTTELPELGQNPPIRDIVGSLSILTSAPGRGFGLELQEKSNQGRLVLIQEVSKTSNPLTKQEEVASFRVYDAKLGASAPESIKQLKELTTPKLALIERKNTRAFLLDRDTALAERYLLKVYTIASAAASAKASYANALRALEEAAKRPSSASLKGDYNAHRRKLLTPLKDSFDTLSASLETLLPLVLSLQETEASLPSEIEPLLQRAKPISVDLLRQAPATFLQAKTLSALFQYRFLSETFLKVLSEHKKKVENAKGELQEALQGKLPKPKYVVALAEQAASGGLLAGVVCLSIKEPTISSRSRIDDAGKPSKATIKTYTLKADPYSPPFEREVMVGKDQTEPIREISNPEIIPEYASQLLADHQNRVVLLRLLAKQLSQLQSKLKEQLAADISREITVAL